MIKARTTAKTAARSTVKTTGKTAGKTKEKTSKAKDKSREFARDSEGKLLTESELELMMLLWRIDEGTVNEVMELLPKERDLAYTSVSTILRILEQKGFVRTRKEGRGHVYVPAIEKNDYEARTVKHILDRVFDGTPVALVRQLLSSVALNPKDLEDLKAMIEKAAGSGK